MYVWLTGAMFFKTCNRKYYVGRLISNELPIFPQPSGFHKVVKSRVEGYFKDSGKDPKVKEKGSWDVLGGRARKEKEWDSGTNATRTSNIFLCFS